MAHDHSSVLEDKAAQRLARRLERYWFDRGYPTVWCRVEQMSVGMGRKTVFAIRSKLRAGLPPVRQ
jgi:hypothetical protein